MPSKSFLKLILTISVSFLVTISAVNGSTSETPLSDAMGLVLASDYEYGNHMENLIQGGWPIQIQESTPTSILAMSYSDEIRTGNICKFESNYNDPKVDGCPGLAQLKTSPHANSGEFTYSFSFMIPESQENIEDIFGFFAQWDGTPDTALGEKGRNPALALTIANDGKIYLLQSSDSREVTIGTPEVNEIPWVEWFEKGVWYNFIIKINWNHQVDGDGYIYAWLSKGKGFYKQIVNYNGPTGYNDQMGPSFKWGINNWIWRSESTAATHATAYYDDVMISVGVTHAKALILLQNNVFGD